MIRALLVDDERWALKELQDVCAWSGSIDIAGAFDNPEEAYAFAKDNPIDLAFLDIEMVEMKGTELAGKLRELYPKMVLVFVSAYDDYLADSCRLQADYYILKPYTASEIASVVERVELLSARLRKHIFIRTFGHFDVFIDGHILPFSSAKGRELLAVLVDARGSVVPIETGFGLLWEGRTYSNYTGALYRKAYARLKKTLDDAGIGDILVDHRGLGRSVDITRFDCDYYRFLDGDPEAVRRFTGEYMVDYGWAEYTTGHLVQLADDYIQGRRMTS